MIPLFKNKFGLEFNPRKSVKLFLYRFMKNVQKSIRLDSIHSASIRIYPKHVFKPIYSDLRFIRIDEEWIGLNRIYFWSFSIKQYTQSFLDWFGMIPNGPKTDFEMNRIRSDWIAFRKFHEYCFPDIEKQFWFLRN